MCGHESDVSECPVSDDSAGNAVDREALKRMAAEAAVEYVHVGDVIGVGSGTTADHVVRALARRGRKPRGAVAASARTRAVLEAHDIAVVGMTGENLPLVIYVDGADEVDAQLRLIKGAGGAHTREKVIASASKLFVCVVDEGKLTDAIGRAPVPVEVLPMARHYVEREIQRLGGTGVLREEYETDNGNWVLDVSGLDLSAPEEVECTLEALPGVVGCGVFARRRADVVIVGTQGGVRRLGGGTRDHRDSEED